MKINKILNNNTVIAMEGQYSQLLKNVDPVSTEIAEKIISYAAEQYGNEAE